MDGVGGDQLGQVNLFFGQPDLPVLVNKGISPLVAVASVPKGLGLFLSVDSGHDRCQTVGLGGSPRSRFVPR